jgi:hypothetical protein
MPPAECETTGRVKEQVGRLLEFHGGTADILRLSRDVRF